MATINQLQIAKKLIETNHISIRKSFFGLIQKPFHTTTGSPISCYQYHFTADVAEQVVRLLNQPTDQFAQSLQSKEPFKSLTHGNVRVELCLSADKQFAALMALRYADFKYTPASDMKVLEGSQAEAIAALFTE
ncbi:MAG TPA: hypothetical protein VIQ97_02330 [Prevotella sp.]